MAFVIVSFVFL
jgi:large subunit ribosomal protein L38e